MTDHLLNEAEARVVASLVEKSVTTPNNYPMTVNAITSAANQKSSRAPVMQLTEGQIGQALNQLLELNLVTREHGARTIKWGQRFGHHFLLKPPMTAVLVAAMLRGPQTKAELRAHSQPIGGPGDPDALDDVIERLIDRAEPLLETLEREPGRKEPRYIHTLAPVEITDAALERQPASGGAPAERAALTAQVVELERALAELAERVAALELRSGSLFAKPSRSE